MMTPNELRELDQGEIVRGYRDGYAGKQAESLDAAYQHGWNNGIADREGKPDAEQRLFCRMYLQQQRFDRVIAELQAERGVS